MEDRRCKLGLAGRLELVTLIERGSSLRAAAAALNVAPATAHRWWHRWRATSEAERASRGCLSTRRPVPKSCPWALSTDQERAILEAREKTNWGPMRLTYLTGRHRSTVWKVLHRDVRQREVLRHRPPVPRHARRARRPPHPQPALHATLERQDRTLLRHPGQRMGPRPRLAQQHPTRPRPVIVPQVLQPTATTLSRQRPTTHHPRSPKSASRTPRPAGPKNREQEPVCLRAGPGESVASR